MIFSVRFAFQHIFLNLTKSLGTPSIKVSDMQSLTTSKAMTTGRPRVLPDEGRVGAVDKGDSDMPPQTPGGNVKLRGAVKIWTAQIPAPGAYQSSGLDSRKNVAAPGGSSPGPKDVLCISQTCAMFAGSAARRPATGSNFRPF